MFVHRSSATHSWSAHLRQHVLTLALAFPGTLAACSSGGGAGRGLPSEASPDGGGGAQGAQATGTVWQATSSKIVVMDMNNPSNIKQETVPLPAKTVEGTSGRTAEIYRALEGSQLVTFARYEGDSVAYRITEECTMNDKTCVLQSDSVTMQFTLTNGKLEQASQYLLGEDQMITSSITFTPVAFPPPGWPTQIITSKLGDAQ